MSRKKKAAAAEATADATTEPEIATRQGVLVVPMTGEEVGQPESTDIFASLTTIKVPIDLFNQQDWVPSPVSAALGLPVTVTRWPSDNARLFNKFAQGLFLNSNPDGDDFGTVQFRRVSGAVLVASTGEGPELEVQDVQMLLLHLTTVAKEITEFVRRVKDERRVMEMQLQLDGNVEAEGEDSFETAKRRRDLAGRFLSRSAFDEFVKGFAMKQR
ncbi:hypothetical protein LTR53_013391 [Teratosphaeriaceae sp. CCFEE 6253]|nr:hypothetical protein LTR53_013391 [Teratosphaeriaceae sp. CCFEE 6253]